METPFVFGKLATGKNFTDRENEIEHLIQNFYSGTNTILISPRRWGKSSLVKKAGDQISASDKKLKVVYIDMFNVRSEEEFYKTLSEKILKAVSGKVEEFIDNSRQFLKQWVPRITFSPDAVQEISLGLNWKEVSRNPDDILMLAENIALSKGLRIVVCIDEFQNISYFDNPLAFQKKIRSHWQKHQKASYCLYGSKRHMLMEVFASPSMPFFKFGDLIFLEKIPTDYWKAFIQKRFRSTGKKITKKQAERIADLAENHPYYVQQLAQQCWFRNSRDFNEDTIDQAMESLVQQLGLLFQNITDTLSTSQVHFLRAIVNDVKQISSKKTISTYNLGTSANVYRIKSALIKKEILDEPKPGQLEILDPMYKYWLKNYYF